MRSPRAALYARVSSDQQAHSRTIASQVASLRERITADGARLEPEHAFLDEGGQAVDVRGTLRNDVAVLRPVPARGVDALRPLPHQEIAGAEHHAVRLLRLVLHRHETHARPLRRLADRLGIGQVVLLPLHEGRA